MIFAQASLKNIDHNLKRRIISYLLGQHVSELRNLDVEANGGIITLRGHVNTFHQKQLCLSCCQRVAGVIQIDDRIVVKGRPR